MVEPISEVGFMIGSNYGHGQFLLTERRPHGNLSAIGVEQYLSFSEIPIQILNNDCFILGGKVERALG